MNKPVINLFLDDDRRFPIGFIVARHMEDAISYFERYTINILSLDHDLGKNKQGDILPTGYDFVKYFCEHQLHANEIYIHTDNGRGREDMYQTLLAAQKRGFIDETTKIYHHGISHHRLSQLT